MDYFNNVSLSRQTITRRIAELSANIKDRVFEQSKSFHLYLIACDERKCDEVCNLRKNKTSEKTTQKKTLQKNI